jgi:phage-related protein
MPPAPSGWTLVRSEAIGSALAAATFTKQAVASDLGSTLTITQPAPRRSTAQLLVYRGFSGVAASQVSTDSGMATHQAPSINVLQGDYVVSLFAERSTQTTAWTAGPGQVARGSVLGTAATRLSTFASDGDAPRSAGTDPGATATVNAPSLKGINMSLVLRP